jgi:hypothetical protein
MAKLLGLSEIRFAPPQFLCQVFLLGHIHGSADDFLEDSAIENRNANAPYVANFPVRPDNPLLEIAPGMFGYHSFNGSRHERAIIGMDESEIFLQGGGFSRRIEAVNLKQFAGPVVKKASWVKSPAPGMGQALSFGEIELASL